MNKPSLPLEDIILPSAISFWPLAWGWWLLIIIVCAAFIAVGWWLSKRLKLKRKQQQAERLLIKNTEHLSGTALFIAVNTWLKIQAGDAYPQAQSLYGKEWISFLNESANQSVFSDQQTQALSQGLYQQQTLENTIQCEASELQKSALLWLKLSKALNGGRL